MPAALTFTLALAAVAAPALAQSLADLGLSGDSLASAKDAAAALGIDVSDPGVIEAAIGALGDDGASAARSALAEAGIAADATPAEIEKAFATLKDDGVATDALIPLLELAGVEVPESLKGAAAGEGKGKRDGDAPRFEEIEDEDEKSCFPSAARVRVRSGAVVRMDELRVGDEVFVGDGYSRVFMFTHADAGFRGSFVRLTAGGRSVTAAPGHFFYSGGDVVRVEKVAVGDVVFVDGREVLVEAVERVDESGLWNPQTVHGDIVVEGFKATTYTAAVEPGVAHALLAPVRAGYRALGVDVSAVFEACAGYVR